MHTVVLALFLILFSFVGLQAEDTAEPLPSIMTPTPTAEVCTVFPADLDGVAVPARAACMAAAFDEARRGCCSWHGGVCGCSRDYNRLRCCDGSLSPSCGC
ncbi:MAG: hypothetical protein GVY13_18900 [Alphaproteobacteria bacterium]|jgi:hypothetical protein|nr:hypothetical protein [Alphaproteobacteria bacterium]